MITRVSLDLELEKAARWSRTVISEPGQGARRGLPRSCAGMSVSAEAPCAGFHKPFPRERGPARDPLPSALELVPSGSVRSRRYARAAVLRRPRGRGAQMTQLCTPA
jgi:hypothetical protein